MSGASEVDTLKETLRMPQEQLERLRDERDALHHQLALRHREIEQVRYDLQQFAYAASHDLQEPLRLVSGFVQLLQSRYHGIIDDKADGYIDHITSAVGQMQKMLQGLTEFSRVETHGAPPVFTSLDEALDQALSHLGAELQLSGAQIVRDTLPTIPADPAQMRQLFRHLIGNAIRFRGEMPLQIQVKVCRETEFWIVSIADNGIGIPVKFVERVFIVFQRLHPRGEYPGIGMGLAVCKRIVERHGGRIWVEPRLKPGTLVRFALPVSPEGMGRPP
ncbi:MAG: ATP-binding protein [Magnetococcus sp. YQC-9]